MRAVWLPVVMLIVTSLGSCAWRLESGNHPPLKQHTVQGLCPVPAWGGWAWFGAGFLTGALICLGLVIVCLLLRQSGADKDIDHIPRLRNALAAIESLLATHRVSGKVVRLRKTRNDDRPDPPGRI